MKDGTRLSLGWQVALWVEANLPVPAGKQRGKPFRFSARQLHLLNECYAYELVGGLWQRVVDHAMFMGSKGNGKSPFLAAVTAAEYKGPVVPYDVDDDGFLRGRANPDAYCALGANSEDQITRTTWKPLRTMLAGSRFAEREGIDVGKTRILDADGRAIEYMSASSDSAEGIPITFFGAEETAKARRGNGGIEFIETMMGNIGKAEHGWMLEVTNAPALGDGSWAEQTWEQGKDGKDGLFVYQPRGKHLPEIKGEDNKDAVIEQLIVTYGAEECDPVTGWVNVERIWRSMQRMPDTEARRKHLNEIRKSDSAFVDVHEHWLPLEEPRDLLPDEPVVLALDPSKSEDSTQLRGFAIGDASAGILPYTFKQDDWTWARPDDLDEDEEFIINPVEVEEVIGAALNDYNVVLIVVDPPPWWATVKRWERHWGEFDSKEKTGLVLKQMTSTPSRFGPMIDAYLSAMKGSLFRHDGHEVGREHLGNAVKLTKGQYTIVNKSKPANKIDDVITQILGWHGVEMAIDLELTGSTGTFYDITW